MKPHDNKPAVCVKRLSLFRYEWRVTNIEGAVLAQGTARSMSGGLKAGEAQLYAWECKQAGRALLPALLVVLALAVIGLYAYATIRVVSEAVKARAQQIERADSDTDCPNFLIAAHRHGCLWRVQT